MSKNQQLPSVILSQPSQDEVNEASELNKGAGKASIGRSNSAPQAQNRFAAGKLGLKSKAGTPGSKLISSPKKQLPNGEQNIPTLSDGVIHVSQEQVAKAAASVLASHEENQSPSPSGILTNSHGPMSPTPLCDSNHSPSSTKRYYQEASPVFCHEPKPEDVWQRRERFGSSGRAEDADVEQDVNMSGNMFSSSSVGENKSNKATRNNQGIASKPSHLRNGAHGSPAQDVSQGAAKGGQNGANRSKTEVNGQAAPGNTSTDKGLPSPGSEGQVDVRRSPHRHPFRQAQSEVILPSEMQRKMSLASVKEKGYARLEEELMKAQKALEMKDEEVDELRGIRERLMKEVSDFTASLFEEVNSQLNEAAINEQQAKKQLKEANAKIEVLTAEVAALKDLVLTSTPSSPNKHLHPQIDNSASKKEKGGKPFWKTHRRSTSHHQFTKESREKAEANDHHSLLKEMDTVVFDEFCRWRLQPTMEFSGQFCIRVEQEDIQPCLNFKNTRLADQLQESVKRNTLSIEPIPGDHSFPRKCCLSETHKLCNYKIKFEGDDEWYSISQMARNRIAVVCDYYAYLRYIVQGLVKCSDKDMYAELVRLRNQMAQARLGLI